MNTSSTNNTPTYRFLAEDIANLFYTENDIAQDEGTLGSAIYWNHVDTIEDMITHFVQSNDLTFDNSR